MSTLPDGRRCLLTLLALAVMLTLPPGAAINQGLGNLNLYALALDTSGCGLLYAGTESGLWQRGVQ